MLEFPPWPNYSAEEAELVKSVLLSNKVNYWTGHEARTFEEEYAAYFESKYSIALANGTLALDLALHALDIGAGDDVVVTSRSFIASASAVINAGANTLFADVDRDSQNITAETIADVISDKTKAIICVHLAGWPCEMESIMALANDRGIAVIEDCAQAHGARYNGKSVGTFGIISAWSFCQDKIMTTGGEGGMITTDDEKLYRKMWSFKDHGKSFDKVREPSTSTAFKYIHDSIGTNWRLTEMQAALGRYQLGQLESWVSQRQANLQCYNDELRSVRGLRISEVDSSAEHAAYKFYCFVKPEELKDGWNRDRIIAEINTRGLPCFTGACPEIYRENAFTNIYGERDSHVVAKELGETSVLLNIHPGITPELCRKAVQVVKDVMISVVS